MLLVSWAGARFIALFAAFLVLACLVDWWVDRRNDTPEGLRFALFWGQVALWVLLPLHWAIHQLRRKSDDETALMIEEKVPSLGHRLISAVQLNRAGATVAGMSPHLIAAVTRQAEEQAATVELSKVSDGRRFRWAISLVAGVFGLLFGILLVAPHTTVALVTRLFGGASDIPRQVDLFPISSNVWPSNEAGVLRLEVTGLEEAGTSLVGEVRITPIDGRPFSVELRHEFDQTWAANTPPMDVPFSYRAWLGDGRLRRPKQVRYTPRPVIEKLSANVLLPANLLGTRPTGQPYEESQRGGDIDFRLLGSAARIDVTTNVPIRVGAVRVQGATPRTIPLVVSAEGLTSSATFPLNPQDRSYAVVVQDQYKFENKELPQRAIRRLNIEPPEVSLVPETFYKAGDAGPPEDREVEGIPVLLGERFALAYEAKARYGLSHVQLRYRVVPKTARLDEDSGNIDLDAFVPLPLGPGRKSKTPASRKLQEEFFTQPPATPDALPDTEGGGRYDFLTSGIPDGKGRLLDLKEGDRIQFYIEAFGKADPDGTPGRSAVREKEVVDVKTYLAWLQKKEDLKERTRQLEEQQRAARPGIP